MRSFPESQLETIAPNLTDPVLLICASGVRTLLARRVYANKAYADVRSVTGGFSRWNEKELSFEIHLRQSPDGDEPPAKTVEYHRQYTHEPSDLARSLTQAGFLPPELFDAYDDVALGPETQRLSFVAEKPL